MEHMGENAILYCIIFQIFHHSLIYSFDLILFCTLLLFTVGLGYAVIVVSAMISVYYNVVIAHVLLYLFASLAGIKSGLPWISCDNWWNTDNCILPVYARSHGTNNFLRNVTNNTDEVNIFVSDSVTVSGIGIEHNITTASRTPAEEYYK